MYDFLLDTCIYKKNIYLINKHRELFKFILIAIVGT